MLQGTPTGPRTFHPKAGTTEQLPVSQAKGTPCAFLPRQHSPVPEQARPHAKASQLAAWRCSPNTAAQFCSDKYRHRDKRVAAAQASAPPLTSIQRNPQTNPSLLKEQGSPIGTCCFTLEGYSWDVNLSQGLQITKINIKNIIVHLCNVNLEKKSQNCAV